MQLTETQLNAEKTVLGNCIDGADKVGALIEQGIGRTHFALPAHQTIWAAFEELAKTPEKLNITDLIQHLEASGQLESVGGHAGLVELATSFAYHFQFEPSVKILTSAKKRRDVEALFISGLENIQDPTLTEGEVLAEAEKVMSTLRETYKVAQVARMADGTQKVVEELEFRINNPGQTKGLPTGYPSLDRMLDGLQKTSMIVIGARPAVGKTSFMTNILYNLAVEGVPVGMFSLEMSKEQLLERTLFGMSKINAANLRRGIKLTKWQQEAFTNAVRKVKRLPFFMDDRGALRIDQIQATARRMVADHGVKCIGVDYLQLANPTGRQSSREREVSEISAGLKALAKELNIPVIVLAQLNREAEKRAGKEAGVPRVSDLRDSGSIEQDADQIMLLYRPYIMDKNADPQEAKIIIGKNRFGETGYIDLKWDAAATTYKEV
ncbi:replicative DNA helicase [Akkermansia sp.]|uniref:replicative DNA helicase n=1 Tax=Akkermansia sp. TaxID=1872421 RepID=UPI0025BAA321|nr:replicative DNA helicase [Akkermansia sp.]MCD8063653.1 replicative DNA helicase [Akkermansia sp.]